MCIRDRNNSGTNEWDGFLDEYEDEEDDEAMACLLYTSSCVYETDIGRCSFRSSFKSGAHIFSSIKSLVNYVKKYERDLEYMVKTYGYCFSVEPGCSLFASSLENIPVKDQKYLPELEALLDKINAADAEEDNEKEELLSLIHI